MSRNTRVGWGALPKALWSALQWRVMLIFIVLMALPTFIAAWPVSDALGALLNHSVASSALAQHFNALLMGDAIYQLIQHAGATIGGARTAGLVVTLLLSPFLAGVVVTAVRASHPAGLGELMHGGLAQYWRMLRVALWSLIPYAIAVIVGVVVFGMASTHADSAILQSSAERRYHVAWVVTVVLLVVAHAIAESSRAQVAADESLRSATRAFGRGIAMLARRPLAAFGLYLGTSIIGYVLAGLVVMWRIHVTAAGAGGMLGAIVLTQLIVIVLAWQKLARIGALAKVAQATSPRGRSSVAALATA
ncbi:MAG TPA: hypothetical protein VF271_03870 [Rhodanobacteraceae bacterium]